jgi:hypothetical protein
MSNFLGAIVAAAAGLLFAGVALAVALLLPNGNEIAPPQSELTRECVGPDCMSLEEIEALVGFVPLEPQDLPEGYVLYARYVLEDEIPLEARERIAEARGVPLSEVPTVAPPTTVHIEYRFHSRPFVPVINIVETRSSVPTSLSTPTPECGEEVPLRGQAAFYGEGSGSVTWNETGHWTICPNAGDSTIGNVVFLKDEILVELKVSLENLSRSELQGIASSMQTD